MRGKTYSKTGGGKADQRKVIRCLCLTEEKLEFYSVSDEELPEELIKTVP
jgi:hypothetical protein